MKNGQESETIDYVRNCDERDSYIKTRSYERFIQLGEKDPHWKSLRDIPVPDEYGWIWDKFLQIWFNSDHDMSGNVIFTYRSINDYCECMKVPFSVEDKKMLFKMKVWAMNKISELDETR